MKNRRNYWKCDTCGNLRHITRRPALNCDLSKMPLWIFQKKFPGKKPMKGRKTLICQKCVDNLKY